MGYLPGKLSSEHLRAWRCEGAGLFLVLAGLIYGLAVQPWPGVALIVSGVVLAGWAAHSYAKSRASVKSAAATPPAVNLQQVKVSRRSL